MTANHPIYSASFNDWRLAGELQVGEEVLAKEGNVLLNGKRSNDGAEVVYNLEVRGEHNFLVGEMGFVVHNNCLTWVTKEAIQEAIELQNLKNSLINNYTYVPENWIRKTNNNNGIRYENPSDPNNFIRMQTEGGANAIGKPWHGEPYYRIADGKYPDGSTKWVDLNGNPTINPDDTHFVVTEIAKLTE